MPKIITGDVVPGKVIQPVLSWPFNLAMPSRVQRAYVTNRPGGPPIQMQQVVSKPIPPRPTGDEKHSGIMKVLQNVMQKQGGQPRQGGPQQGGPQQGPQGGGQQAPISAALPGDRSWRG